MFIKGSIDSSPRWLFDKIKRTNDKLPVKALVNWENTPFSK